VSECILETSTMNSLLGLSSHIKVHYPVRSVEFGINVFLCAERELRLALICLLSFRVDLMSNPVIFL
jgi:hypothetical protein